MYHLSAISLFSSLLIYSHPISASLNKYNLNELVLSRDARLFYLRKPMPKKPHTAASRLSISFICSCARGPNLIAPAFSWACFRFLNPGMGILLLLLAQKPGQLVLLAKIHDFRIVA